MLSRTLVLLCAVLLSAWSTSALAQQGRRIDILTGEPVKPRNQHPGPEPEIFNAPHAPRQEQRRADDPPIEIYVAPQIGTGSAPNQLGLNTGRGLPRQGRPLQTRQFNQSQPYYGR